MATSGDKVWTAKLSLHGLPPGIMFDRYMGDNTSKVANSEKMYKRANGEVYIPQENFASFLSAENTRSAARALYDTRKYKDKAAALKSFVQTQEDKFTITRNGKPVVWLGDFDEDEDGPSGIVLDKRVARLKNGIPNPKERPVILAPWDATFTVMLFPNDQVKPDELKWLVETGMMMIGMGTYRGVFGRATVEWE